MKSQGPSRGMSGFAEVRPGQGEVWGIPPFPTMQAPGRSGERMGGEGSGPARGRRLPGPAEILPGPSHGLSLSAGQAAG